jgi:nucleotide-binding universal stress UspA family protein
MQAINKLFHPTDLSAASEVAFSHALKLALSARADLTVMHVASEQGTHREDFPSVRSILAQWGIIPAGSGREAVGELGLSVRKVVSHRKDPVHACQHYLESHAADLVVLAVHQNKGGASWLHPSVGQPIVRNTGETALIIPHGVDGFVRRTDGGLTLRNILVPVAIQPHPQAALEAVTALATALALGSDTIVTLLYVGDESNAPALSLPASSQLWNRITRQGDDVVDTILETALSMQSDLVVMVTEGRHGFFDALRGSTAERVLRKISCPLLSVPA